MFIEACGRRNLFFVISDTGTEVKVLDVSGRVELATASSGGHDRATPACNCRRTRPTRRRMMTVLAASREHQRRRALGDPSSTPSGLVIAGMTEELITLMTMGSALPRKRTTSCGRVDAQRRDRGRPHSSR